MTILDESSKKLQLEFNNMSSWDEFIAHKAIKKNIALFNYAVRLSQVSVRFKDFQLTLNNKDSLDILLKMDEKEYLTNARNK